MEGIDRSGYYGNDEVLLFSLRRRPVNVSAGSTFLIGFLQNFTLVRELPHLKRPRSIRFPYADSTREEDTYIDRRSTTENGIVNGGTHCPCFV